MKAAAVLAFALVAVAMGSAYATTYSNGLDVSSLVTVTQFKCMKTSNPPISHVIVRAFRSTGSSDPAVVQTLKNAVAAGYDKSNLGVYIFPRPLSSAGVIQDGGLQVRSMMNNLVNNGAGDLFTSVWMDIEGGDLYWSKSTASNVNFVQQMLTEAKKWQPKYSLGIYTSKSQWGPIVGSTFTGGKDYPLWYASYNGRQDFTDFSAFAGWTSAFMHQYAGDATVCGIGCDRNIAPTGTLQSGANTAVINGGAPPPPPVIANSAKCAAVHGACQDIQARPCVGSTQSGLCPGASNIVCCVSAPVLRSSAPGSNVPTKAATHGRIIAEAIDTGKVTWHRDRKRPHAYRRLKMGGLMRVRRHKKKTHRRKPKASKARVHE